MARGNLPRTQLVRAGVAPAAEVTGDPVNNHVMTNDGSSFLLAHNTNDAATARVVTIHVDKEVDGLAVADRTVSVPAAASRYIGPFPVADYGHLLLVDADNAELKLSAYHL